MTSCETARVATVSVDSTQDHDEIGCETTAVAAVSVAVDRLGPNIDHIDRSIIEQLQRDGRAPYTRLAAAVGLSEAAVRQRVQRLTDAGESAAIIGEIQAGTHDVQIM